MAHNRLTPAEYITLNGTVCPFCRSSDTGRKGRAFPFLPVNTPSGPEQLRQRMGCFTCGQTWIEVYKLVKYVSDVSENR